MADSVEARFHETWLGMVQPVDGLVVSVPVLVEAQCMERQPPETQERLRALCPPLEDAPGTRHIADLDAFFAELLELTPDRFDRGDALPDDLALYVPESAHGGRPGQTVRPTDRSMQKASIPPRQAPTNPLPVVNLPHPLTPVEARGGR